jgi:hypothetical protein
VATYSLQEIAATGTIPSYAAVASTDKYPATDGKTFLHVKNASVSSINVTVTSQATATEGLAAANLVVAVGAGAEKMIRISAIYIDSTGFVNVAYSATTTVTAGAFHNPA